MRSSRDPKSKPVGSQAHAKSISAHSNKGEVLQNLIGWREFVALPDLGLAVLKAKVDTGARTSALHAFKIEPFEKDGRSMVRFHVHPVQKRNDIVVVCEAPVIDHRIVSDSGGHRERRFVIQTTLAMNSRRWSIELTLVNRESMSFRMLLGRTAMHDFTIDPASSYLLGRPKKILKAYKKYADSKRKRTLSKLK